MCGLDQLPRFRFAQKRQLWQKSGCRSKVVAAGLQNAVHHTVRVCVPFSADSAPYFPFQTNKRRIACPARYSLASRPGWELRDAPWEVAEPILRPARSCGCDLRERQKGGLLRWPCQARQRDGDRRYHRWQQSSSRRIFRKRFTGRVPACGSCSGRMLPQPPAGKANRRQSLRLGCAE